MSKAPKMPKMAKNSHPSLDAYEQYYIKRGKKYIPFHDPYAYEGLSKGAWLVIVEESGKSIRTVINPKFIELDTALRYLEDGLCSAISAASKMRPNVTVMSKKEQRAWDAYRKIMGKDIPRYFSFPSNHEIAEKGCDYIRKIMLDNNVDMAKIKEKYGVKKKEVKNSILGLEV